VIFQDLIESMHAETVTGDSLRSVASTLSNAQAVPVFPLLLCSIDTAPKTELLFFNGLIAPSTLKR
jgi:hypothetical protein